MRLTSSAMHYTSAIEEALRKAAMLHDGQHRKGAKVPFIVHPTAVACIVAEYTDDEEIVIAALLHDSIEDTEYRIDELRMEFSERVADIVCGVTEHDTIPEVGWKARRELYIDNLKESSTASAMVSAADKIHNMCSILRDYEGRGEEFSRDFAGSREERIEVYRDLEEALKEMLGEDSPIMKRFSEVFKKYSEFIQAL